MSFSVASRLSCCLFLLLCLTTIAGVCVAGNGRQVLLDPHADFEYLPQTPSVAGGAVGAMANPASWALGDGGEMALRMTTSRSPTTTN